MSSLPRYAGRQASILLGLAEAIAQGIENKQPADRTLRRLLLQHRELGSRDRRLFGDALFAWLRWNGWVHPLPLPRALLAAWYLDGQEASAAHLALYQDLGLEPPPQLSAECDLRSRHEAAQVAFENQLAPFDALLPAWIQEELSHLLTQEELFAAHTKRPPTWLRIDQAHVDELEATLNEAGGVWDPASPLSCGFSSAATVNRLLREHPHALEIQDLASQQVVRVCAPQAGETWWDACCGPGGKSLQLLDEADRSLDLTATDRREGVLKELIKRGRRHGLAKIRHWALDLLDENALLPNLEFDGILVDAPCSGSGTWARNPDGPWRTSRRDVRQTAPKQKAMLERTGLALKSGGRLVYAVCSLAKTETVDVVASFLADNPAYSLLPCPHPLSGEASDGQISILPERSQGDGMFIAMFVKT